MFWYFDKPYHSHTSTAAFIPRAHARRVHVPRALDRVVVGNVIYDFKLCFRFVKIVRNRSHRLETPPLESLGDHKTNRMTRDGQFRRFWGTSRPSSSPVHFLDRNGKRKFFLWFPTMHSVSSGSLALVHADAQPLHDGDARAALAGFLQQLWFGLEMLRQDLQDVLQLLVHLKHLRTKRHWSEKRSWCAVVGFWLYEGLIHEQSPLCFSHALHLRLFNP